MPEQKRGPSAVATGTGGMRNKGGRPSASHSTTGAKKTQPLNFAAWALRYALAGWQVLPLLPGSKEPATPNGWHDASDDPEQIAAWWARWPNANIGLALSPLDGRYCRVAFDVDPRHGGKLEHIARLGLDPTQTVTQRTRGDGWHVIYDRPAGIDLRTKVHDAPGLDVLTHGYIVAAPSVVDGKSYRWERNPLDVDMARLPLELAERLAKRNGADPGHRAAARPTTTGKADVDAPALHVLEHALAHLDPWQGDYHWWLECLMALHSAYPGADGLDLAERWGDGKPGEIAEKWAGFDAAGGVTWRTLVHHAKAAGWRPELATEEQPTRETAHDILHRHLAEQGGGDCPICGKSFFERRVDGDTVLGRRRVMMCHKRDCTTWQTFKAIRQVEQAEPWAWPAWFVSEHDPDEWSRLIDGPLAERADWLGAPLVSGKIALFAGWPVRRAAVSVSLRTMLEMAGERILTIPASKRLRRAKPAARAKREPAETGTVAETPAPVAQEKPRWQRWAFGLDLLGERDALTVLAIIEAHGGTVDAKRGRFAYPLARDAEIRAGVGAWMRPERPEPDLIAFCPTAQNAIKSGAPALPEQIGYRSAPERVQKLARLHWLEDTERAYRVRDALRRA